MSAPLPVEPPRGDAGPASSRLLLVGNPNVGKSVVFGALTGRYAQVSNYPGTTVELTRGKAHFGGAEYQVIDTPGTNNLLAMSEDEAVARDILVAERGATVVQVSDAKNLRRALLLSVQLAEAGVPFVLALNMLDEARSRGIGIDPGELAKALGVEVVGTVAVVKEGIEQLVAAVPAARPASLQIAYAPPVESAVARLLPVLPETGISRRALALLLLADDSMEAWAKANLDAETRAVVEKERGLLAAAIPQPLRTLLGRARLETADRLAAHVMRRGAPQGSGARFARFVGDASVHPVGGFFVLAAVLLAAYYFVGVLGAGIMVDWLESVFFAEYVVPWTDAAIRAVVPSGVVQEFLAGPPGVPVDESSGFLIGQYGLVSMALSYGIAIVLPIVTTFFIAFSIMEDSGYLPRLAVVANKAMKAMGLNGKAVLPMVLGLGCDTMATMTARIMETKKERVIVTLLLALGVPCSAQLGVILGMLSGISLTGALFWSGSVLGTILLVGWLSSKVLPGESSDFLLELPPIRRPQLSNILVKVVARIEWYLKEALPLFLLGTFVLWVFDRLQLLPLVIRAVEPVVTGVLGLPKEAGVSFVIGFLRRDYGAAGLFDLFNERMRAGTLGVEGEIQVVVAMTVITLFVPCIANFFMIVKERGLKTGLAMVAFIFPFAVAVGGVVNVLMHWVMG
ncbi:ferrous iron transport protein B [Vulgatibacter sp.]|uniref:ferrous iron transport protein B n=1 Tax=Vulgatibacter sp. TaxID=1971226 RepID=UPI0035684C5A